MQFQFPGFTIAYVISAALCSISAVIIWKRRINIGSTPFALLMISLTIWSLASIFEAGVMTENEKFFWSKLQYLGITTVSPLWLLFSAQYTKREKLFSGPLRWLIWIIPTGTLLLAFTNENHKLIWTSVSIIQDQFYIGYYDHGVAYFVHMAFCYVCLMLGTIWLLYDALLSEKRRKLQSVIFVISVVIGWGANITYNLRLFPIPGFDITPITISLLALVMAWTISRFRLFDLVPIARIKLFDSLREGVIVIDSNDFIIEINPAALEITEYEGLSPVGHSIWDVFCKYADQIGQLKQKTNIQTEIQIPGNTDKVIEVQITSIDKGEKNTSGQLIVLRDISERKQYERVEKEQRVFAEALADSAAVINSSLDLDEVLERILDNVVKVVPHEAVNIALVTEPGKLRFVKVRTPECYGVKKALKGTSLEINDLLTFRSMSESKRPLIINNTQTSENWNPEVHKNQWMKSYLGAPISFQGELLGFINLDSDQENFFKPEQAEHLQVFSEYAAMAIKNARLYADVRFHAEEMTILYEVGLAIATGIGLEKTTKAIFQQLKRVIPVDLFFLALFELSEKMVSYFMYQKNEERIEIKPFNLLQQPSLTGYVIDKKETLYIPDFKAADTEVKEDQVIKVPGFDNRTFLGVPLILRGEIMGVLSVQSAEPNAYLSNQIRLVETIAQQATIAMDNAKLFERMQELAITDGLTNLYNRRYFYAILDGEIERTKRYETPLTLIMMDIDHFKFVNDNFGHLAGDQVLESIANLCKQLLRQADVMFRYGGEEFMILLPETESDQAYKVAERIRRMIAETDFETKKGKVKITISIGIMQFNDKLTDQNDFIESVDKALYQAKQAGRNCVRVFSPKDN